MIREKKFVTFYSPGTLFSESTTRDIESEDPKLALQISNEIVERYNAKPYGFRFETKLVADPVPDGRGGTLKVQSKTLHTSGMYFIGGKLETLDEVEARDDPNESILQSNMRSNNMFIVHVGTRSYRSTLPFEENDVVIHPETGAIVERGDDPKHVTYRSKRAQEKA